MLGCGKFYHRSVGSGRPAAPLRLGILPNTSACSFLTSIIRSIVTLEVSIRVWEVHRERKRAVVSDESLCLELRRLHP